MQIKSVAIIGAGAIGGVYACSLHKLLGDNFAFIFKWRTILSKGSIFR